MKKILCIIILFIFAVAGCSDESVGNEKDGVDANDVTFSLPLEITKGKIDMDGDGNDEMIKVTLLEGEKTQENKYKGNFFIELFDKDENKINKIDINAHFKEFGVELSKDFPIVFKDYNGDGILDFNIGYPDSEEREYIYHFYTLSEEKVLEELNITDGGSVFKSCEKGHSYDFKLKGDDGFVTFVTYGYNEGQYEYKEYGWTENGFLKVNYIYSSVGYEDVDEDLIKEKINKIISSADTLDEKNFLKTCKEEYNWLLENSNFTSTYMFMNDGFGEKEYQILSIISKRIDKMEQLNSRFSEYFNVADIQRYSLDEVKEFKSVRGDEDYKYKEYLWELENKSYTVLAGKFYLNDFLLLFDKSGKFLDGFVSTNKTEDEFKIEFREKQNYLSFAPINMGSGTGISHKGAKWFEIYEDKLITALQYPVEGYEAPPYTMGYSKQYKLIDENYNEVTGDFQTVYKLEIPFYSLNESIELEKTVNYVWDTDKGFFQSWVNDFYESLDILFSHGIEDEILDKNYEKIKSIIENIDNNENKEDNIGEITAFLKRCSKSEKRDMLLDKLDN
jgi:hypothetical protein